MNFAALFEGGFTQRFINRLGQVDARMNDIRPWPSFGRLLSPHPPDDALTSATAAAIQI
jgi:hypothetical protein